MRVAVLPSGALLLDTAPGADDAGNGLSPAARARFARAVQRGIGHAQLDLGASELDAPLAPAARPVPPAGAAARPAELMAMVRSLRRATAET